MCQSLVTRWMTTPWAGAHREWRLMRWHKEHRILSLVSVLKGSRMIRDNTARDRLDLTVLPQTDIQTDRQYSLNGQRQELPPVISS